MSDREGKASKDGGASPEPTSFDVPLDSIAGGDTIVDPASIVLGSDPDVLAESDRGSEREIPAARSVRPRASDGPLGVGDIVAGKYAVERVLGRGGMGQILAAKHMELGTMVAVKIVLPEALGSDATVGRFKREALAMASLRSEHAVRIIDVGDLQGMPYLIMEYLEGNDLAAELRRRGPLPVKEAAKYVLEAIDVLAEAHDIGIVHRDLKPGNLFLALRPSGSRSIRVLDFGIAKPMVGAALADEGAPRQSSHDSVELVPPPRSRAPGKLTMAGMTLGTPNFMAPEQVSSGQIGPHTDVWGIGATLYTLLTGALPFTGPSLALVCGAVCTLPPIPPRDHRPEIPQALEAVILRCLNKSPMKRFASIRELAAAVEHATNVRAPSTTMGLRAPRPRPEEDDDDDEREDEPGDQADPDDDEREDPEESGQHAALLRRASSPPAVASYRASSARSPTVNVRAMVAGRAGARWVLAACVLGLLAAVLTAVLFAVR